MIVWPPVVLHHKVGIRAEARPVFYQLSIPAREALARFDGIDYTLSGGVVAKDEPRLIRSQAWLSSLASGEPQAVKCPVKKLLHRIGPGRSWLPVKARAIRAAGGALIDLSRCGKPAQ